MSTTNNEKFGSYTAMTVTNLQSLASSATAGWQSARVSNVSTLALDYNIFRSEERRVGKECRL